ncbi:hypothetical protein J6590_068542 [Homalodisca vitripennis]|nr:hypothetical protein J6590_068542 [Homalodisca vitripennis]
MKDVTTIVAMAIFTGVHGVSKTVGSQILEDSEAIILLRREAVLVRSSLPVYKTSNMWERLKTDFFPILNVKAIRT